MNTIRKDHTGLLKALALLLVILTVLLAGAAAHPAQAGLRGATAPPPTATAAGSTAADAVPGPAGPPAASALPGLTGSWAEVPSPNTGSPNNTLYGVAAIAPNDVWAVGAYGILGVASNQLILHWDGTSWSQAPGPSRLTASELLAISAVSANDIWAVGGFNSGGQALAQHWDGTSWTVVPNANPGTFNRFFGAAAVSSNDVWAVGYSSDGGLSQTLVERWDGTRWQAVPSPNIPNQHNRLNAVTAVPGSPGELWAVGDAGTSPLILHWNGTQWSIVPSPNAGITPHLMSVTAISASDVWIAGWTSTGSGPVTLTMRWNGSAWSVVPSPNPSATYNYLYGVDALAPDNVWAVGDFNAPGGNQQVLILRWNGTAWVQVPGENIGPSGIGFGLQAVSALSASDVWSVGSSSHTLVEHWNGAQWRMVASPNAGVGDNVLNAVSAGASNDVWQVGYYGFGIEKRTLIQHWNGSEWTIVTSPNTNKRTNVLEGVVALSATDAWAVGSANSGNALDEVTLILHWDGKQWTRVPSPSPGTAGFNALYAVDASGPNDVWAVGSFTNSGSTSETLVLHWDGTSWSVIPGANVAGVHNGLYGVTAVGPNDVWAAGYSGFVTFRTLIAHWNGSTWSVVPNPDPENSSNILEAVAASGPGDVAAVGRSRNLFTQQPRGLAEQWDGSSWRLVVAVGAEPGALYGVAAVAPGDGWAVGDSGGLAVIGRWNGSSWSEFPGPEIAGRLFAATAINACDVWAVGQRYVTGTGILALNEHFTCN